MKQYRDAQWLKRKIEEEWSMGQIARLEGVSAQAVIKWAKKFGYPTNAHIKDLNHIPYPLGATDKDRAEIRERVRELVDGLLLGGGTLVSRHPHSAYFTQASVHRPYIEWIRELFAEYGIGNRGNIAVMNPQKGRTVWRHESRSYIEFRALRERWYQNGRKTVPLLTELTPRIALLWHLRSGSLEIQRKNRRVPHARIRFSVARYAPEERERLVMLLKDIDCHPRLDAGATIAVYNVCCFLDYIGDCPIELLSCFAKKWLS